VQNQEQQPVASSPSGHWGLARLFIAGVLCLHVVFAISVRQRIERGYPDFTVFYTAARTLRAGLGHQLYDLNVQYEVQQRFTGQLSSRRGPLPYIHPPFEALIFLPLAWLPYLAAFLAWDLLNIAMLFGIAFLLRGCIGALRFIPAWQFVLATLAFFPVFDSLLQGQDSILQLLFCVLAWRALRKDADLVAGCWVGLAAFKFQFIIPAVLLMIVWKRRRVLAGFAAVCAVLTMISAALVGWDGLLRYPAFVLQIANSPGLGGVPASFLPNLRGLIAGWPFYFSGTIEKMITGLVCFGLFLFAAWSGRRAIDAEQRDLQFSLAIALSVLIAWQTNISDFSLLLLPLVLIADDAVRWKAQVSPRRFAMLFPALPLLLSPLWLVLWLDTGSVSLMAIPLLAWVGMIGRELAVRTGDRG